MSLAVLAVAGNGWTFTTERGLAPGWMVDRWSVDDGLPLARVESVALDGEGRVWISTFDGIATTAGAAWQVYRRGNAPELSTNRFYDLVADRGGALWFAGEGALLYRYLDGRFTEFALGPPGQREHLPVLRSWGGEAWAVSSSFYRLGSGEPELHAGPLLGLGNRDATMTPDGAVWAVDGESLVRLAPDLSIQRFPLAEELFGYPFGALFVAGGQPFLTSSGGLMRLHADRPPELLVGEAGPVVEAFCQVVERPGGEVLARSASRWWRLADSRLVPASGTAPPTPATCRFRSALVADGRLWEHAGQSLWRDGEEIASAISEAAQMTTDRLGNLWIATQGSGLVRLRRATVEHREVQDRTGSPNIKSLLADDRGRLWAANETGGLLRIDEGKVVAIPVVGGQSGEGQAPPSVWNLANMPGGELWAITGEGLCRMEAELCRKLPPPAGASAV